MKRRTIDGVVAQVRTACKPQHRLATALGFALGGFVPLASYVVAHYEIDHLESLASQSSTYLVLGGLVFSARTVFAWARMAFLSGPKALGFVVLAEGVMVFGHTRWLGIAALVYLIAINGIATGVILAIGKEK